MSAPYEQKFRTLQKQHRVVVAAAKALQQALRETRMDLSRVSYERGVAEHTLMRDGYRKDPVKGWTKEPLHRDQWQEEVGNW